VIARKGETPTTHRRARFDLDHVRLFASIPRFAAMSAFARA
jgi:hypothetical protein